MNLPTAKRHLAGTNGTLVSLLLIFGLALGASHKVAAAETTRSEQDRIVSIGGTVTEIAYALGAGDRIVAVDATSLYPKAATEKPNVGYMRQLAAEPILALEPSLVLAVEDAGPVVVLDQLREAGVAVVTVPDEPSYPGVIDKITRIAEALDATEEGQKLAAHLESEFKTLSAALDGTPDRPRVLFMLSIGQGGVPMAAGRDTSAEGIIHLAGGINAVDAFEGYKPLSPEAAVAAQPDVLLITTRSLGLLGGKAGLLDLPEVAVTPAGQASRILSLDGLLLLGFGPRTGEAVRWLAQQLHPNLELPSAAEN